MITNGDRKVNVRGILDRGGRLTIASAGTGGGLAGFHDDHCGLWIGREKVIGYRRPADARSDHSDIDMSWQLFRGPAIGDLVWRVLPI